MIIKNQFEEGYCLDFFLRIVVITFFLLMKVCNARPIFIKRDKAVI